jgi:hypothetical protein
VRLVATPARWYWQDASNERENLTRLGGHPSWIQSEYPSCPDCGKTMAFLFQLDAVCPGDGGETFGDGILYTFWCDTCRVFSLPRGPEQKKGMIPAFGVSPQRPGEHDGSEGGNRQNDRLRSVYRCPAVV